MAAGALRIVYADAALCVVDKPARLLSVPGRKGANVLRNAATMLAAYALGNTQAVAAWYHRTPVFEATAQARAFEAQQADRPHVPDREFRRHALKHGRLPFTMPDPDTAQDVLLSPLVVHRLDEGTSGLLLFAWTFPVQRSLMQDLAARRIPKTYEAVVDTRWAEAKGSPVLAQDTGLISTPIGRAPGVPLVRVADPAGSKACVTEWHVLERGQGAARLLLRPHTGKTHQLRVHCALPPPHGLGCPIVGDSFYGHSALAPRPLVHELQAYAPTVQGEARALHEYVASHVAWEADTTLLAGGRRPHLASCKHLPAGGVGHVPRLLLHARDLTVPDHFHHLGALQKRLDPTPYGPPSYAKKGKSQPRGTTHAAPAPVDDLDWSVPLGDVIRGRPLGEVLGPWQVVDEGTSADYTCRVAQEGSTQYSVTFTSKTPF